VSDPYKQPYVESSVFVAFIKGEVTQGPNHDQDAKKIFDSIIDAAKAGMFPIVTSALTIAEVFKNMKNPPLTDQQNEDLRPYFREDYIQIVEIDRDVGDRANELCRTLQAEVGFKAMRPNDAIHIASAERAECDVVLAWDPDFISQKLRLSTVRLENPEKVTITATTEQNLFTETLANESGQNDQITAGIAETEPTEQLPIAAETDTPATASKNPITIRGDDGSSAQDQARVKEEAEGKVKGPDGVQSQPTP
jgi:predicted nucleic acid-binding protein